jgi:predicted transcriptional regulator of viral defense system
MALYQHMRLANKTSDILNTLKKRGIFSYEQAKACGLSHQTLMRLVLAERLAKVTRGIFYDPQREWSSTYEITFGTACLIFGPNAYISAHSALDYYGLCLDSPRTTDVMVPPNVKTKRDQIRLLRTKLDLNIGVQKHKLFRIASAERAILDSLYFSHLWEKKGFAFGVMRTALARQLVTYSALENMADKLGIRPIFENYAQYIHREVLEPM